MCNRLLCAWFAVTAHTGVVIRTHARMDEWTDASMDDAIHLNAFLNSNYYKGASEMCTKSAHCTDTKQVHKRNHYIES